MLLGLRKEIREISFDALRGEEEYYRQRAADRLEGKRSDVVHAHALRDEGETPDDGSEKQAESACGFVFHIISPPHSLP